MDASAGRLLEQGAASLGLGLSKEESEKFKQYSLLLEEWNAKINLTGLRSSEEVVLLHFLDSLHLLASLPNKEEMSLVDIGTGAGFPGAVCALMRPKWSITLVERVQKKAAFLMTLRRLLNLTNVQIVAEDVAKVSATFDVAVSRAAFHPGEWVKVGSRLVKADGILVAMTNLEDTPLGPKGFIEMLHQEYTVDGRSRLILGWESDVPRGTSAPAGGAPWNNN